MKKIIAGIFALASLSAFSQIVEFDDSASQAMKRLMKSHTESSTVAQIKQEVEAKYNVICEGSSSVIFPDMTKQVKYSAACKGNSNLKLTVVSKFKAASESFDFEVKSYSVDL
jgi:hypothetical protein